MKDLYKFASFRLETEKRLLCNAGDVTRLKPKTFETLLFLLENNRKVLTKDEIIMEVWNGTAVSDDSLTQQISQLRKILDDGEHEIIATVSGIGYEFTADVCKMNSSNGNGYAEIQMNGASSTVEDANIEISGEEFISPHSTDQLIEKNGVKVSRKTFLEKVKQGQWRVWAVILTVSLITISALFWRQWKNDEKATITEIRRIAVLPFKAVGETDETNALKQGMTDALVTRLSRIEKLTVLPTSLVAKYNAANQDPLAAAKELNVEAVLDGRIQKEAEQIRVIVQLVRTNDGKILWSEVFLDEFTDIFDVQYSIARKVSEALSLEVSEEEKRAMMKRYTTSAEAYRLYLEGIFFYERRTSGGRIQAQKNFQQAIELDPNFALAYIGLARIYVEMPNNIPPKDSYKKMEIYGLKALEIDPELAEAYSVVGFAKWRGEWNWSEPEKYFKKAMELRPITRVSFVWYALYLSALGRHNEALSVIDKYPLQPVEKYLQTKNVIYNFARDYDKCIESSNQILSWIPNNAAVFGTLSMCYAEKKMYPEAIEAAEKNVALEELGHHTALTVLVYVYAQAGEIEKARETAKKLEQMPDKTATIYGAKAVMYAALGEKDKAFRNLDESIEQREWWGYTLKVYPYWDSLRDDPRFEEMLEKINLAD